MTARPGACRRDMMDASRRAVSRARLGATLSVIFRKSSTRLGFLARLRVSATASLRPLMTMAKRLSVMFSGPWPERMRCDPRQVEDVVLASRPVPAIEPSNVALGDRRKRSRSGACRT